MSQEKLSVWLHQQLSRRGWSLRELARRANIPDSSLARINHADQGIGAKTARRVADALGVPAVRVFELAGILGESPPDTADVTLLKHIYHMLTTDERRQLIDYAEFLRDKHIGAR